MFSALIAGKSNLLAGEIKGYNAVIFY